MPETGTSASGSSGPGGGAIARGGGAILLLAGGFGLLASGIEAGFTLPAAVAAAGLGAVWLALEWGMALRRARGEASASERLRTERSRLRSEKDGLEQAYRELRSQQADLVNSARLATLGSLVAGIAHELDTPLGSLRSNHDTLRRAMSKLQVILEDERVDESELDEVRRIVRALDGVMDTNDLAMDRMIGLVGSLRTFGRPDSSERDRIDLHEALDDTVRLLEHRLGEGVRLEKSYGRLPRVECHPAEVNQVFMNLLLNASQALEGPGEIEIRTAARDDTVEIEVRDTGKGIPDEHLDRIFEPGFSTRGSRMGMGLGLLITHQIVDRHGGQIEVESEVGEGTSFTVSLPVSLPASADEGG